MIISATEILIEEGLLRKTKWQPKSGLLCIGNGLEYTEKGLEELKPLLSSSGVKNIKNEK